MAVAWIGDRETLVERACERAATLLQSSRCPVFSFDTDVHGTRAAIALAERIGAAYDHLGGAALSREATLITDKGAMTVAPGEARRRADVIVMVGEVPAVHRGLVAELAETVPDLGGVTERTFFSIGANVASLLPDKAVTHLSCEGVDLGGTLASVRAQRAGRAVAKSVSNFEAFAKAMADAKFPVFLFSGHGVDGLALEMLQGLVADINRKSRASSLLLPASETGWGSAQTSTWMTGFPPRTGFARGFPEYDPWRFDVARMIASGEADLHLRISNASTYPPERKGLDLIALAKTAEPVAGAAVTIVIGEAGIDHEGVVFSARTGTLAAVTAREASELPSAASVLRSIAGQVAAEAALPC
jgi:formylmethanofuran dehydrogenase subunit B